LGCDPDLESYSIVAHHRSVSYIATRNSQSNFRFGRPHLTSVPSFLPTSIAASLVQFFLAFYAVVRLVSRLTSPEYNVPGRTSSLRDIRILQALAFTLLVLLTLVPMAVATDVLGDCVPFAIGSIPVLGLLPRSDVLDQWLTCACQPPSATARSRSTTRSATRRGTPSSARSPHVVGATPHCWACTFRPRRLCVARR
jgi:hypothetical protein